MRRKFVLSFISCLIWAIALNNSGRSETVAPLQRWPAGVPFPTATSKPTSQPFVLGGSPSFDRRVVGLVFYDDLGQKSICSGLYIDSMHVLTAKHCTCHGHEYYVTNDDDMLSGSPVWTRAVLEKGNQAGLSCNKLAQFSLVEGNDIALLTLESALPNGHGAPTCIGYSVLANIQLLDVWSGSRPAQAIISGYGKNPQIGGIHEKRLKAPVPINSDDCSSSASVGLGCVSYKEMILGIPSAGALPKDSCPGDSGGPAYLTQGDQILPIGVVSRSVIGAAAGSVCGAGGVYTLLGRTDVIGWLHRKLPQSGKAECGFEGVTK